MTLKRNANAPADTLTTAWDGHYMYPAFLGFVGFASKHLVDQYREETGDKWEPGRSPIDRMIDEATGADRDFAQRFMTWCEGQFGTPADLDGAA